MKRFTQLYTELDRTNRTNDKVGALESYFREAAPADAAWALYFLGGQRIPRVVSSSLLSACATEEAKLPAWLIEECYGAVGDFAETIALVLPGSEISTSLPLHDLVEKRLLPLSAGGNTARLLLAQTWRELNATERFVWNKLITGNFRVGVAKTLVIRALAAVAGVEPPVMAHRLMGQFQPTVAAYEQILHGTSENNVARPYPFFLASPLESALAGLGNLEDWHVEWKWDGIRAQLIRRAGEVLIWSRGDELVTETFPEVAEIGAALPDGTVLDGEILAWQHEMPQPFARLQRRLGRKLVSAKMRSQFPVVFLAFDLLECQNEDLRNRPLSERREQLETVVHEVMQKPASHTNGQSSLNETADLFEKFLTPSITRLPLRISSSLKAKTWDELTSLRAESRSRHVEGLMLKRKSSLYGVGRQRGDWWKWKIEPLVMDAVLINAQLGHGRRASLYTDYTFGVWHEGKLVPVAKAYSGLSDEEILEVDRFVRSNTQDKFGPIRAVKPKLVFELAFEAIQKSGRHKSGIAVRFPRMNRWRHDKTPADADSLENLRALLGKENQRE